MRRSPQGFTLIELLLAISVTAILATTVYASLMVATTARDKATEAVGANRTLLLALDLLRRDLQSVPPPTGTLAGGFLGEDDNRLDTISFTTANSFLPPKGRLADLINVELMLVNDDLTSGRYMLVRYVTTNLLAPSTTQPQAQVLARGLSGWDVSYSDSSDWIDDWDSTQQDDTLPLAVRITLYRPSPDNDRGLIEEDERVTRIFMLPAGTRGDSIFSGGFGG